MIATVYGLAAIAVWFLLRRPGGDRRAVKPLTVVLGLLALQGARRRPPVVAGAASGDRLGPRRPRHRATGWRCSGPSPPPGGWSRAASRRRRAGRARSRGAGRRRRLGARRPVLPFWLSIGALSLVQAALVAAPRPAAAPLLARLRNRCWALVPPLSIVVVVGGDRPRLGLADFLTYLALVAVPPLAALALGGDRPRRPPTAGPAGRPALRPRLGRPRRRSAARPPPWPSPPSPASASAGCSPASSPAAG